MKTLTVGNNLKKLQEADKVLKEFIQRVVEGKDPHRQELRGKVQDVMNMRQILNPILLAINVMLCYNKHTDPTMLCAFVYEQQD